MRVTSNSMLPLWFSDEQRCEEFFSVPLDRWMSAAQDGCIRNLVAFVADVDQADVDQVQVVFLGSPEFRVSVRLTGIGPIGLPMRKKIARVRPSGFLMTTVA